MTDVIAEFRGEHAFLSNFYVYVISVDNELTQVMDKKVGVFLTSIFLWPVLAIKVLAKIIFEIGNGTSSLFSSAKEFFSLVWKV